MKTLFSVLLLAITAFAQNNRVLPKGAEIKVRTDSAIPAKPAAGASYGATISQDVTDTSGAVLIPRGSPARLVAVNNGKDTTLDLRSVTINGRSYLITVAGKSSSSGLGANKRHGQVCRRRRRNRTLCWERSWAEARELPSELWYAVLVVPERRSIAAEKRRFLPRPS